MKLSHEGAGVVSGYRGTAFDGAHVYYAPSFENTTGTAIRYDTDGGAVADAASYEALVLSSSDPNAVAYFGAIFDGRYVYLAPDSGGGDVVRIDTTAPFTSFDHFSIGTVAAVWGYHGGVFDGRYIYFIPWETNGTPHGNLARYDTTRPFTATTSWATMNLASISPSLVGMVGGAFDGRFLYLVLNQNTLATRYDTRAPFADASSWTTLDFGAPFEGTRFRGAAFDGRYLYYVPEYASTDGPLDIARFDTTAGAFVASALDAFDLLTLPQHGTGYVGAAFDGQYLYLGPEGGSVALRFHVRSPPGQLTSFGGSFL